MIFILTVSQDYVFLNEQKDFVKTCFNSSEKKTNNKDNVTQIANLTAQGLTTIETKSQHEKN